MSGSYTPGDYSLETSIARLTADPDDENVLHAEVAHAMCVLRHFAIPTTGVMIAAAGPVGRALAMGIVRTRELEAEVERLREQVAFYRGCSEAASDCTPEE